MKLQLALISTIFMLSACDKKPAETEAAPTTETAAEVAPAETAPAAEKPAEAALEMVTLTAEGTTFDPPVKPEQIPAGAWYCDMGTVEYASLSKGDGKCPACGMMLKEKVADGAAAPAGDDHAGHDHDHEGHDH